MPAGFSGARQRVPRWRGPVFSNTWRRRVRAVASETPTRPAAARSPSPLTISARDVLSARVSPGALATVAVGVDEEQDGGVAEGGTDAPPVRSGTARTPKSRRGRFTDN
jgi:hypothetical protein